MRPIFKNKAHEDFFRENGYIKLPFDRANEIDTFKKSIYALHPSDNFEAFQKSKLHLQDFHCTFFDTNSEYRQQVFEIITSFFAPLCNSMLNDYKFIQSNIFLKPPHKGYVAPHQNITVVNETDFTSLSFWCPAQDTTFENGTMLLVPGSHKRFMKYRTTNISWPLLDKFKNYDSPYLKTIDVQKGEILIIDDSIIHGTTNNTTDNERFVFHAMLAPKEAAVIFCNVDQQNQKVKIYRVADTFWQYYMPGETPEGLELLEERPYNETALTDEEFKAELYDAKTA